MFDAPEADAVNATLQLAVGTVPATMLQLVELKLPATPAWVKETLPVGVVAPTVEVSVTVTVHVDGWFTSTGLEQAMLVLVECRPGTETVEPAVPETDGLPRTVAVM